MITELILAAMLQTGTPPPVLTKTDRLVWDQDTDGVTPASGLTYKVYVDNATSTGLSGVICATGAQLTVMTCSAPFPALTPGLHTLTLTAADPTKDDTESGMSNSLVIRVTVAAPRNLRKQ